MNLIDIDKIKKKNFDEDPLKNYKFYPYPNKNEKTKILETKILFFKKSPNLMKYNPRFLTSKKAILSSPKSQI